VKILRNGKFGCVEVKPNFQVAKRSTIIVFEDDNGGFFCFEKANLKCR